MNILSIETSCDETAAAVIRDGKDILSNVVVSQIDIHSAYGGVIPEIAARSHIEAILPVIDQALLGSLANLRSGDFDSRVKPSELARNDGPSERPREGQRAALNSAWSHIDAIAVTNTPGLLGSLLIGTLTARTLALTHHKDLYGIHHIKSHIYANWLSGRTPEFPIVALVISGGHTQLIHLRSHTDFEIIGTTRDDAVGEAFDKVAKILGLPYPGGPAISQAAATSPLHDHPELVRTEPYADYQLPIPQVPDYDFSFSGLKTAVLRAIQHAASVPISFPSHELAAKLTPEQIANFAASFENTAIDILIRKLALADANLQPKSILLAGGVAANSTLRDRITTHFGADRTYIPEPRFSTDNAAMVGSAAYYEITSGRQPNDPLTLEANPHSSIH
jgi:N6-L-threonylcarbamoyladenine synthase